ncbi:MAG TPA: tetratricopeptide repeat protein [Pyrinomonadaceae bacterium]|jgi:tetratricopeptide (TPR) repeat protein|nr:tetratricopeptide repeat protein [Pyrinomonadaceae bacterium]
MIKINSLRPIALLLLLVAVATPLGAQNKKQREQAKKLQDLGDKSFVAKNFQDAIDKYGQSIAVVATNPYAHYRKAFAHLELKQNVEALNEFSTALTQGFKPLEIYRVRAFIYYQILDYERAAQDIRAGLQLAPSDLLLLKGLGEVDLAKNDPAGALEALRQASTIAPNDADVDYYLARTYAAVGNPASTQTAAENALKKGTRFVGETYILLGGAHDKQHNWSASIDAYTRAIAAKQDNVNVYRNLGEAYRSEGRYTDAINAMKQGLRTYPNSGALFTDVSWYYSLADRPQDAVEAAKAAVIFLPKEYLGYTNLCRAYNDNKQYDLAINACNTALRIAPGDGETYFYLGRAMNLTGKNVEATKMYSLAVKGLEDYVTKLPDYSDGWYLLGNAYFADNQRDKAGEAYLKCLQISPKYAKARYNLGIIYTRKKMKPAAQEQYNKLLELDPKIAALLKAEIDKM